MGRRGAEPSLHNGVREKRTSQGLSQQELARRAGVTRQAVNAIEAGRYVPNTSVALRLGRALGCPVEELFQLDHEPVERLVHAIAPAAGGSTRVVLADVNGRLVAHSLTADRTLQEGFASADAILKGPGRRPIARLLVTPERLEHTALVLGCDPSLQVLVDHLARHSRDAWLAWLSASSGGALEAVARGEAHLAGSHLRDPDGGYNLTHARQALGGAGGLVVAFASWEQGFVVAHGNPAAIQSPSDLARPDVRLVNRQPGAGCRQLLDDLLRQQGIPETRVQGYSDEVTSHLAVARAVAGGIAEVGLALRAAGEVYGLDFIPLVQVRFDLIIPRGMLAHPTVLVLLHLLQGRALREEIAALPGYEVSQMGAVMADIPVAA